ncbi:MAG: ferredoxin-type protein NapF [Pseudomonadota bacterium]
MSDISRRSFFQARLNKTKTVRPPWAVAEKQFIELCNRCDDCISICPEKIIIRGDGGFPEINFINSGCEFCEDCLHVCKTKALLQISDNTPAWSHKVKITQQCLPLQNVICRICFEACDEEAILFELVAGQVAIPQINIDNCNGCGFCVAMCPVDSMVIDSGEESRA